MPETIVPQSQVGMDAFLSVLRAACKEVGGQNVWARQHDLSPQYVSDVVNGRRDISRRFAEALGWDVLTFVHPKTMTPEEVATDMRLRIASWYLRQAALEIRSWANAYGVSGTVPKGRAENLAREIEEFVGTDVPHAE